MTVSTCYLHIIHDDLSALVTEDLSSGSGSAATLPTPVINCDGRRVAYFYTQIRQIAALYSQKSLHNERHT